MKRILSYGLALLALAAQPAHAARLYSNIGFAAGITGVPCKDSNEGSHYIIIDASSPTDCDATGGGSTPADCICRSGVYAADPGGFSDSFKTIDAPVGTDPVADSATDTLAITCASPLTCTGNSTTDSLAFNWSGTFSCSQMPAWTGDATNTACALTIADDAITTTKIANDAVTLAKMADMATASFIGRTTSGTGDPEVLSVTTVQSMLGGALSDYNPDQRPAVGCAVSGALCEGFSASGGTAVDLSGWNWANQSTATETIERGSSRLTGVGSGCQMRVRWQTLGTTGVDFSLTEKLALGSQGGGGPIALISGTEASPTAVEIVRFDNGTVAHERFTSYAFGGTASRGSVNVIGAGESQARAGLAICIRVNYTASSKTFATYYSLDCETWHTVASAVMGSHPTSVGYMKSDCVTETAPVMRTYWWRYLVGSGWVLVNDPVGQ